MNPPDRAPDDVVSVVAEKLIGGGRALAHHCGATWMVAGALPGEKVSVRITKRRAGIVEAQTLEVLSDAHLARLHDPCPQSGICGGCDWPHVDPGDGANLKAAAAAEAARAFPDLAARISSAPIHLSEGGYRLRARLHWDGGQQRLGFYEHRSRKVASIDSCLILSPRLMKALPQLTDALSKSCPYHVDLEWLEGTKANDTVAALRQAKGGPKTFDPPWIPKQNDMGSVVSGFHALSKSGQPRSGWGPTEVTIDLPIPLKVPIGSFFQGNRHLIDPLFRRVAELVGGEAVPIFDLHAGVGYLAAAARFAGAKDLTLVEPYREAAQAAGRNLAGAQVIVGSTAEDFVAGAPTLPAEALVITDPPRTGLSKNLRINLANWQPRRILMLGCDPATWARDAGFLAERGYSPRVVEIFDLFPSTHHLEILALLERG